MRSLSPVLLLACVLFLACSNNDNDDDATPAPTTPVPTTTQPTSPPASTSPPRSVVGFVNANAGAVVPVAKVDDTDAAEGAFIRERSIISTEHSISPGQILFTINELEDNAVVVCDTWANSRLQVLPNDDLVILWSPPLGTTYCAKNGAEDHQYGIGEETVLRVSDPIFGVVITEAETIIKIVSGAATAIDPFGAEFQLRADEQLVIPIEGGSFVEELQMAQDELRAVDRLRAVAPLPDLTVRFDDVTAVGETCVIVYTVSNSGRAASAETVVRVEIDGELIDESLPPIEVDQERPMETTFDIPCPFDPDLGGELNVDPENTIAETDDENNTDNVSVLG